MEAHDDSARRRRLRRHEPFGAATTQKLLPIRYLVREDGDGPYLTCVESSNLTVRIRRDLCVTRSAARKYPPGTIFLDGAAQGEPFMDVARRVYNLDHHEGCVRAFTLATCEQAMVLLLKGFDLGGGEWTIYANEPDLDTVLALWLLLNYRRVTGAEDRVRRFVQPLVRLQGVIDAHGLELVELTAFEDQHLESARAILDGLRGREAALRRDGSWAEVDPVQYTLEALVEIDLLVFSPHDFDQLIEVEELERAPILGDRLAVVCRSEAGIYEVERQLGDAYGDRLGIIVLQKDARNYTVRQVDPFLPATLDALYERLNLLDPAVDAEHRWGGSAEIGGSPRGVGTDLSPRRIAHACRRSFRPPRPARSVAVATAASAGAIALVALCAALSTGRAAPASALGAVARDGPAVAGLFGILLALAAWAALGLLARGHAARFALRRPRSLGWVALLPVVATAALAGGVWAPLADAEGSLGPTELGPIFGLVVVVGAVGAEALFRGLLFALLAESIGGGSGVVSIPNLVAALLSSACLVAVYLPPVWLGGVSYVGRSALVFAAALVASLACGLARERSASIVAPLTLHGLAALVAWVVVPTLG